MLTRTKMKLYFAVKDLAVQAFGIPFLVRSQGEALRSFQDEVNKVGTDSAIAAHPDDYELYKIATYDEVEGTIAGQQPELIARAKDLLTPRS